MLKSLVDYPQSHTVEEWLFSTFVQPVFIAVQKAGILAALQDSPTHADELAKRMQLHTRSVRCFLNVLAAVNIIHKEGEHYTLTESAIVLEEFTQITIALQHLVQSIEAGIFEQAQKDGILPSHAPADLVMLGIAERRGQRLVLTEPGYRYFVPNQSCYLGRYVCYTWRIVEQLSQRLDMLLKLGHPELQVEAKPDFIRPIVELLFPLHLEEAQQVAKHLAPLKDIRTVLDLGAGAAVWSVPFAKDNEHLRVDAFDYPPVLDVTRSFTERYKLSQRYRFFPGDFMATDHWGEPPYDLIYLGYLCSGFSEKENQYLLSTCARHLRPGGYVVLVDYFPRPDRTGPLLDILFALHMVALTPGGDTYPASFYECWCQHTGLSHINWITVPGSAATVLIAQKAFVH